MKHKQRWGLNQGFPARNRRLSTETDDVIAIRARFLSFIVKTDSRLKGEMFPQTETNIRPCLLSVPTDSIMHDTHRSHDSIYSAHTLYIHRLNVRRINHHISEGLMASSSSLERDYRILAQRPCETQTMNLTFPLHL